MVPAKTREVTIPRESRTSNSGVAPTRPSTANVHVVGYSAASFFRMGRGSISESAVAMRSRARTTFSTEVLLTRLTASATRFIHSAEVKVPSPKVNVAAPVCGALCGKVGWGWSPIQVIHELAPF